MENLEQEKFQLEKEKFYHQQFFDDELLQLKKYMASQSDSNHKLGISPFVTVVIAVFMGLAGVIGGTYVTGFYGFELEKPQSDASISLEQEKLETSLILQAIETNDPNESATRLLLFKDMGFIADVGGAIERFREYPDEAPTKKAALADNNWFNVVGSFGQDDLDTAREYARIVLMKTERTIPVEIYKTAVSENYAVIVGGPLIKGDAIRLAAKTREMDIVPDAFAQINKRWEFIESIY